MKVPNLRFRSHDCFGWDEFHLFSLSSEDPASFQTPLARRNKVLHYQESNISFHPGESISLFR